MGTNGGVSVSEQGTARFLGDECHFLNERTIAIHEDHTGCMYFGSMKGAVYKKG